MTLNGLWIELEQYWNLKIKCNEDFETLIKCIGKTDIKFLSNFNLEYDNSASDFGWKRSQFTVQHWPLEMHKGLILTLEDHWEVQQGGCWVHSLGSQQRQANQLVPNPEIGSGEDILHHHLMRGCCP
ncbi:unnamed protein product [Sphenostylis stenocarpa]|uniref:Uncharacterized protein n=1 Tax=Sphenostylis stenocarpa TaxID=92480 RepID=A0AA86SKN0_9FABA|nr:unnamed protein product [Sphenostylis stenocarpa]